MRLIVPCLTVMLTFLVLSGCNTARNNDAVKAQQNDACERDEDCFGGLACSNEALCAPLGNPGTAGPDAPCTVSEDCRFGLLCNRSGVCAESSIGGVGDGCLADSDCESRLRCANDGTCLEQGANGTLPAGSDCDADDECAFGLVCGGDDGCVELPRWAGVTCEGSLLPGPARVVFDVPRGRPNFDFYRLPFPNDVRRNNNALDLSGFPGAAFPPSPGDFIGRYVSALSADATAFSNNTPVIFRFSKRIDFSTLKFGGDNPTFRFIDVTPGTFDDGTPRRPRARFFATNERSRYVCQNWLGIRPSEGSPLTPGHTYAVFFERGILDDEGVELQPAEDFAALLSDSQPIEPALAAAWNRYQPFRAYLAASGTSPDQIIGGTVFTTDDPTPLMARMRPAVQAGPRPTISDITTCDANVTSPCGTGPRGCGSPNPLFTEVHGKVALANFIQGVPPYSDSGGRITFVDGAPRAQRQEQVCFSATVPKGDAPAGGWPVILFAHDVGGDFKSPIASGLAANMARAGWAVLSYDGLLQGNRSGGDVPTPSQAVLSLDRLDHAGLIRDQGLQATADIYSMARLIIDLRLATPDGNTRLDRDKTVFMGHGRGAEAGVPFAAYELRLSGVILASAGAGVVDRFRLTTKPVNQGARLSVALADPELNGMHPGLHLLQHWLDPIDPMNFGDFLRHPPEGVPTKHVFMLYGTKDTRTPGTRQNHLAISIDLPLVGDTIEPVQALDEEPGTAVENVSSADGPRTQGVKQYAPDGDYDGSEVAFQSAKAKVDLTRFLEAIASDEAPEIRR